MAGGFQWCAVGRSDYFFCATKGKREVTGIKKKVGPFGAAVLQGRGDGGRKERGLLPFNCL